MGRPARVQSLVQGRHRGPSPQSHAGQCSIDQGATPFLRPAPGHASPTAVHPDQPDQFVRLRLRGAPEQNPNDSCLGFGPAAPHRPRPQGRDAHAAPSLSDLGEQTPGSHLLVARHPPPSPAPPDPAWPSNPGLAVHRLATCGSDRPIPKRLRLQHIDGQGCRLRLAGSGSRRLLRLADLHPPNGDPKR